MDNIDGYVTKDDLYRLISKLKMQMKLDQDQVHSLCEAIKDMPAEYPDDDSMTCIPYKDVHIVSIGKRTVYAEPFILQQNDLLYRMYDMLRQIQFWLKTDDVQECFLVNPSINKSKYFCDAVDSLSDNFSDVKL